MPLSDRTTGRTAKRFDHLGKPNGEIRRLTRLLLAFWCSFGAVAFAHSDAGIQTLKLVPIDHMTRAELHYIETVPDPRAVLILCPGVNGSGEDLIRSAAWQEFAKSEKLGLVGLSFASPLHAIHDGTGYYYASKGSGQLLLDGVRRIYGRDLPLVLWGFSGGAHFTSRFTEWSPSNVLAWCAYSAGWWDHPVPSKTAPPGVVACGDQDAQRYGPSLVYFKQGRSAGKPWLWVSLDGVGHVGSARLESFVRSYFSTILAGYSDNGIWVDVDLKTPITKTQAEEQSALSAWLPSQELLDKWRQVHTP